MPRIIYKLKRRKTIIIIINSKQKCSIFLAFFTSEILEHLPKKVKSLLLCLEILELESLLVLCKNILELDIKNFIILSWEGGCNKNVFQLINTMFIIGMYKPTMFY